MVAGEAVLQRVSHARVSVDGETVGAIGRGLLVLVGIAESDDDAAAEWCCRRLLGTRLWEDADGKAWAASAQSAGHELLLVSQFTLYGSLKWNKPDFHHAMGPAKAKGFWEALVSRVEKAHPAKVQQGRFGAKMEVTLANDGPVTLTLDSPPPKAEPPVASPPRAPCGCLVLVPLAGAMEKLARVERLGVRPIGLKVVTRDGMRYVAAVLTAALVSHDATAMATVTSAVSRCVGNALLVSSDPKELSQVFQLSELIDY
ncbi:hypothetical protein AB1Y20_011586 [Prymnesium parvum]|uniref:D-aminoacyl-tRNA deacylase n=1 Tax=Prymnesium parvum TaxID=97485 RepID=A0AB34IGY6_PRYPA